MTFVYVINKSSCTSSHYCHWWTAIMSFGRAKCVWEGASGDGLHNDNCSNVYLTTKWGMTYWAWNGTVEDDKIKRRSSLSPIFLSSACTQRSELPKPFAELADTTTHARSFGHPLVWIAAAPQHPRPLRPFLRLPFTMQLSSKTPNQTMSAIGSRCHCVPVGTSDEGRQSRLQSSVHLWPHWATETEQTPREESRALAGKTGWSPTSEMSDLWPSWHRSLDVKAPVTLPPALSRPPSVCECAHIGLSYLSCWIMNWVFMASCLTVTHSFFGHFCSRAER